jgi:pimeloyl-ACP methyl ester carboxylesterase
VDNGGGSRIAEYTYAPHPKYGGGEAAAHLAFLTDFVLPHVQNHYRVSRNPAQTAIGGSSLGGLMALYAVQQAPESFGTALVLSPAFWFLGEEVRRFSAATMPDSVLCWARMGTAEGRDDWQESFAVGAERLNRFGLGFLEVYYGMRRSGWPASHLNWALDAEGEHRESWWARQLPEGLRWWLDHPRTQALPASPPAPLSPPLWKENPAKPEADR